MRTDVADFTVANHLRHLRADHMQDWRAEYLTDDSPADANVVQIMRGANLTEGKVRGALKRLEAAGTVVDTTSAFASRSRTYAHAAEVASTTAVRKEERRKDMENRHGNAQSFRDELIADAEKAQLKLIEYIAAVEATDDMLVLDRLNVPILSDNLGYAMDKD